MENCEKNQSLSSTSNKNGSTKSLKSYRSLKQDHRKATRSHLIESQSEVTLNILENTGKVSKVKRLNSAPASTTQDQYYISDNNNVLEEKKQPNRNPSNEQHDVKKSAVITTYNNQIPHYVAELKGPHSVRYISGHINQAYVGHIPNNQPNYGMASTNRVMHEQYWSWPCCQRNDWSRREKVLSFVIIGQSIVILALVIALIMAHIPQADIVITPNGLYQKWKS